MNKSEILALGVPEEKVREFQTLYNRDVKKRVARTLNETRANAEKSAEEVRCAIIAMLSTFKDPGSLQEILAGVVECYLEGMKKAAQGGESTLDSKAEQKVSETQCSVSSLHKNEEECQV